MRHPRTGRGPAAVFLLVAILGTSTALAQSDLPTLSSTGNEAIPTASSAAATSEASSGSSGSSRSSGSSATDSGSSTTDATTTASLPLLSSDASSASNTESTANLPSLSTSLPGLTGFPTIPGGYNYPPPTVPPMANAPYLRKSNLPQDTVFIVVGAVIAFAALMILGWRILVAWSINRSVRNTSPTGYAHMGDGGRRKSSGLEPNGGAPMGSAMSLENLGTGSKHGTTNSKTQTPNPSLFFSPTAGAGTHTYNSNRASSYLPSGYYNAGTAAPGGGTGMTTIGGGGDRGSKLRLQSGTLGTARAVDPTPPGSPDFRPSTGGASIGDSRTSLNPGPPGERTPTPSAFLDDLMSNGPSFVPRHGYTGSKGSLGRDRDIRRY